MTGGPPKTARRNTRRREKEDASSENNEGKHNEEIVAKGLIRRGKEKMPREGSTQGRKKPHTEDKRSTDANDDAQPRKKQGASKSTWQGTPTGRNRNQ